MKHSHRLARHKGEHSPSTKAARSGSRSSGRLCSLALALALAFPATAPALPDGGQISAGSGTISRHDSTLTVTQSSPRLSINWHSFNIGQNETVNFAQPGLGAIALNRILGSDPSAIYGRLNANGQVFLLNPNGLLFGPGAQVNVGGLVASTLNLGDADFLAGRYRFSGNGGEIVNRGSLSAGDGGYIALLGGQLSNESLIQARLGTVALAAGNQVSLDFAGDRLVSVQIDQGTLDALAQNRQLIRADGGSVLMTARAADAILGAAVNNSGVIEARTVENHNGTIRLLGDRQYGSVHAGGTLDASAPDGGDGGFIETSAARVRATDDVRVTTAAPFGRTGIWLIDPDYYTVAASGGDITGALLASNLNGSDIILQADIKITIDDIVNASANANAHNLTLDAPTVDLNQLITLKAGATLSGTASAVNVNGPAAGIQNGIDVAASGGTVDVAAGTYMLGARLNVNKPLALRGAQHGVDPRNAAALRTPGSGAETIIDGGGTLPILLRIGGHNVTVDGFEFRNGTGDLIDSNTLGLNAPVIRYNLIHGASGDEGVQIRYAIGPILEYNRVYDAEGDGLNLTSSVDGVIRYNEVHDNNSINAAIYVYGSKNTLIQGNYVHDVHLKEGIKLGDSGGEDATEGTGGSIIDNIIDNTFSDAITIYSSDVTVSSNQISNSLSQDGAIFVYYDVNNVAITNNTLSNNGTALDGGITYGIRIGSGTKHPTNVTVTGNTFSNNEAQIFDNNGAGQVPAFFAANNFDRSAMASGDNRIWSNIQDGLDVAASGATVTVGAGTFAEAVDIATGNVTLKLAGNATIDSLAGIAGTFANLQNYALTVGDNTTTTFSGNLSGAGGSLTKTGSGTLTLAGTNSYSGGTTVSAGTLAGTTAGLQGAIANNAALVFDQGGDGSYGGAISGSGTLTKAGSGTVTLTGTNTYTGATTLNAGILSVASIGDGGVAGNLGAASSDAANLVLSGGTLRYTGADASTNRNFTLSAGTTSTIEVTSHNLTLTGASANTSGALTKTGAGMLTLAGANLHSGTTMVTAGTLAYGKNNALASGMLTVNGGTLDIGNYSDTVGAVTLVNGSITGGSGALSGTSYEVQNGTISAILGGTAGLTKTTAGTVSLTGTNTYTGATTIQAGALSVAAIGDGGVAGNLGAAAGDAGNLVLSGGTLQYTGADATTNRNFTLAAGTSSAIDVTAHKLTLTGASAGTTGALTKTGAGTLTLAGANAHDGATTVSAGRLIAAHAAALGSTAGGTAVASGATLEIANLALGNEAVTLNGSGIGGNGALTGSGAASLAGPITLASDSAIGAAASHALSLGGMIDGPGALSILGGGSVTLNGDLGSGTALASFSAANGTALTLNGGLVRTGGAQTYSGSTTFGAAATLRTTAGGSVSAPGAVTATAGTLTLDTGSGDISLTNPANDFGTLAVSSGRHLTVLDANALTLADISVSGLVEARTQTGDLTLSAPIATTSASANAVTLVADAGAAPNVTGSGGNFINAGAAAITTGAGGAWRIYSGNPAGTNRGGLAEAGKRYNTDDGSDPLAAGNRIYFRIQPTLTLTADNQAKTYGAANPAFTYSHAGLIDGDLIGSAVSSGPSYTVDGSTSASGQLTAETPHSIIPGSASSPLGYALDYANGTLTVGRKTLTVPDAAALDKAYDGTVNATLSGALAGVVSGDAVVLGGAGSFDSPLAGTLKPVTASLSLTGADAGNYSLSQPAGLAADITPAALTVTANNARKTYDGQAFSGGNGISYSGFVNGETSAVLGGALVYGGSAQGAVNIGRYLIEPTGLTSANYAITFVDGTLAIATSMPDELTGRYSAALSSSRVATAGVPSPFSSGMAGWDLGNRLVLQVEGGGVKLPPGVSPP